MKPSQLSQELRKAQNEDLTRRRWIIGLSLLNVTMGQIVTLYQTGIIKKLPDPPLPLIDSNKVNASNYAYSRLRTPDAVMMIINSGMTAWLASTDGQARARTNPLVSIAMGAKTLIDLATTVELGREEWKENKALCFYCQTATVFSAAAFLLAIPETLKAFRNLRS